MTDREREYYNTYVRVRDFGVENAADFPLNSAGDINFKIFAPEIVKVEDRARCRNRILASRRRL